MIGNFRPPKDHDTLLRAWRAASDRLAPTGCRLHLLLAGKEEFPETVDRLQRELGVERIVHRLGAQTDIAGILADCDFACFSSRSEGLPNAVLEPMAAGLAVAATDLPALRESMPAAQHPFLSPQGDFERLAGSIVRLAADPEAARGLGSMNRAHVTEFFAPGKVFRMYTEALRRFGVSCLSDLP
jgi:glycosyltransferase involved in cell wall biosynthesis